METSCQFGDEGHSCLDCRGHALDTKASAGVETCLPSPHIRHYPHHTRLSQHGHKLLPAPLPHHFHSLFFLMDSVTSLYTQFNVNIEQHYSVTSRNTQFNVNKEQHYCVPLVHFNLSNIGLVKVLVNILNTLQLLEVKVEYCSNHIILKFKFFHNTKLF